MFTQLWSGLATTRAQNAFGQYVVVGQHHTVYVDIIAAADRAPGVDVASHFLTFFLE